MSLSMSTFNKTLLLIFLISLPINKTFSQKNIFIEAESFSNKGGWVIDQQAMNEVHSPYILAHGLGKPVKDAVTQINVSKSKTYRVWVRTRNWVAPWKVEGAPGKFQLIINGKTLATTFGTKGASWDWQDGGVIKLKKGKSTIALHDLTGFNGRCDAILLTRDLKKIPTNNLSDLADFRKKQLNLSSKPLDGGKYDLVVVGGGIAGICSAISGARLGLKVALIQNRPVLGGNNSSEVRVGLSGLIFQENYPNLGGIVDELDPVGHWTLWSAQQNPDSDRSKKILKIIKANKEKKIHNAGPGSNYDDDKKLNLVLAEENITLFLNTHVYGAKTKNGKIISVTGKNIENSKEYEFKGAQFVDCTGDGTLGYLAGADFRIGRESKTDTGEVRAPLKQDSLVMGTSVQWNSKKTKTFSPFPETTNWAVNFNEVTSNKDTVGDWDWETGAYRNQITEIEFIRDYALRVVYGNWDFIKNKSIDKEKFANRELSWVAYIGGKRESRRLLGDLILTEQDILGKKLYDDRSFTTTWGLDLHYPVRKKGFTGEAYRSRADIKEIEPYQVPYRCLYSRNVTNLFMAGRNISVTHVALGTVRVQATTGMMGEVIGMAAYLCKTNNSSPRGVYKNYLKDLKILMEKGVGNPDFWKNIK